ncbi:MAG: hypothetical protein V7L14_19800 [Nostoc sp.]
MILRDEFYRMLLVMNDGASKEQIRTFVLIYVRSWGAIAAPTPTLLNSDS